MAIVCPRCNRQYDVTLFEFDNIVECDCGARIKLDPLKGVISVGEKNSQDKRRFKMSPFFISGSSIADKIKNLIHKDTQIEQDKVYLTVKQIYLLGEKGRLDFSGKELSVAKRKSISPEKKLPEDKYGWWKLNQGTYLIEFNERVNLNEEEVAILQPREELLQNCCFHPFLILTSKDKISPIPLSVGCRGMEIKQNARVSVLRIIKLTKI